MKVTRRYRFSASHRLHAPSLSADDNERIYGKCNNPFGHGHDYILEVALRGRVNESTGLLVNVHGLDDLVRREVIDAFDHRNLNTDVPEFGDVVPTSENLALEAGRRLQIAWQKQFGGTPAIEKIRIHETRRNIFELSL